MALDHFLVHFNCQWKDSFREVRGVRSAGLEVCPFGDLKRKTMVFFWILGKPLSYTQGYVGVGCGVRGCPKSSLLGWCSLKGGCEKWPGQQSGQYCLVYKLLPPQESRHQFSVSKWPRFMYRSSSLWDHTVSGSRSSECLLHLSIWTHTCTHTHTPLLHKTLL